MQAHPEAGLELVRGVRRAARTKAVDTPAVVEQVLLGLVDTATHIPPTENAYFVRKLISYVTTSQERRLGRLEYTTWWDYVKAETKSTSYQQLWGNFFTADAQAVRSRDASTRSTGLWLEQFFYNILGLHCFDGSPIRVLNGRTNEAFINPVGGPAPPTGRHLRQRQRHRARHGPGTDQRGERDRRVGPGGVDPGHLVRLRRPFERAVQLWSPSIVAADPGLGRMKNLRNGWMVGHQLFLRQKLNINRGHIGMAGSPWALVSVQQAQFWNRDLPRHYGAGTVQDILSTCISDWQTPGILFGKPAAACTREEIAAEVWAQAKVHLQGPGST